MGSATRSNERFNLTKPLLAPGSSPLFSIIISSDHEEVNPWNGMRVIFVVPFPNLDEVSSEASQSSNRVLDEVFEFMVPYVHTSTMISH